MLAGMSQPVPPRPPKIPQSVLVVIHTPALQVLLLERADHPGYWQSVTGSRDTPDEPLLQTCRREVEEETGIRGRLLAPLGAIDFWFVADDRRVHKTVHHFLLEAQDGALSDADIEVVEVAWVPLPDVPTRLAYSDERRLAERAATLLDTA